MDPGRLDLDQHLVVGGHRLVDVGELQHLGSAIAVLHDCLHGVLPWGGVTCSVTGLGTSPPIRSRSAWNSAANEVSLVRRRTLNWPSAPVTLFDHAPAVPVELARAHDPDDGGAVPQGLPLGLVLAVLVPQRRIHLVDQRRAVGIGDPVVELGQEDKTGAGPVDQLGDGRDEVVPAPQGRERLVDRGDHLGLVELLAGEGDNPLALLDEPDQRRLPVVARPPRRCRSCRSGRAPRRW